MKTILIVDDEPSLPVSLKAGMEARDKNLRVLTADNGEAAVELVESTDIDLMITDLKMPEMNGFQLLAYMKTNFPSVPCIMMTAFWTPEVERRLRVANAVTLLEKPIDFDGLMQCVNVSLNTREGEGSLRGIPLSGFLQLIEMEEKTCLLEVRGEDDHPGLFYFNEGELYDTLYKGRKGEEAVYEMLALDNVRISFKTPPMKRIKKRIGCSLTTLLKDAAQRRDDPGGMADGRGAMSVDAVIDSVGNGFLEKRGGGKGSDAGGPPAPIGEFKIDEIFDAAEEMNVDDIMEPAGEAESNSDIRVDSVIDAGEDMALRDNLAAGEGFWAEREITEDDLVFVPDDDDAADFRNADPKAPEGAAAPGPRAKPAAAAGAPDITGILEKMKYISGFRMVGVFSHLGEMIAHVDATDREPAELCALAGEVLMKARKTTESMGLGPGHMVHIESREAQVIARCLEDPVNPDGGRVRIHVLLILDRKCNLAMAKMKLETVLEELAPVFA